MTPNSAPQSPARPSLRKSAAERRRGPSTFRGSLERRLPQAALVAEAECLPPPVGRSEAFAEDLSDATGDADPDADPAPPSVSGRRGLRLRWFRLPMLVLVLSAGTTLALSDLSTLVGF